MKAKQSSHQEPALEPLPSEDQVREFLRQNTDFFERHPDLLDQLRISHRAGAAVSLVEKQVSVLRERNVEMRRRLTSLTGNARENDRLYGLTGRLVLSLLDADGTDALSDTFTRAMREDFKVEHVSFILFTDAKASTARCRTDSADRARAEIGALLKSQLPVCGTLRAEELRYLFPEAGHVGSAAVVPLVNGAVVGVIAIGSEDPHRYGADTGTVFLGHIADVIARLLPRFERDAAEGQL